MVQQHTASGKESTIWAPIAEEQFLETVKAVFVASGQVAGSLRTYDLDRDEQEGYIIPFSVEYELAQDIAFVAANEEQAKAVSAATVTKNDNEPGIAIAIASNAGIQHSARKLLNNIAITLQQRARRGRILCR
jgi:hypothetical protein